MKKPSQGIGLARQNHVAGGRVLADENLLALIFPILVEDKYCLSRTAVQCVRPRTAVTTRQRSERGRALPLARASLCLWAGMILCKTKSYLRESWQCVAQGADCNGTFTTITGYSAQEAVGQTPRLLSSGRHSKSFYREMWAALKESGNWCGGNMEPAQER